MSGPTRVEDIAADELGEDADRDVFCCGDERKTRRRGLVSRTG